MRHPRKLLRDHYACALLMAIGLGALGLGWTYPFGSLGEMGPGFFPVVLGALMILVAIAVGMTASRHESAPAIVDLARTKSGPPEWRGWICIVAGISSFVVLGAYGGFVPAAFASVFISALGDRENTVTSAAILGAVVTAFGVAVFHFGLHLQLQLFQWGG